MRKLAIILLLTLLVLPGCEKKKPDIVIPMPTRGPNPVEMRPTTPPPHFTK